MATKTFSVGRDLTAAVLIGPDGTQIDFPLSTSIKTKANYDKPKSTPINSPPQQRALPAGHDITIDFDRVNGTVEKYFSQIESAYWAGNTLPGTGSTGVLYLYFTNPDGSKTTWNYQGVSIADDDSGTIEGPKNIKQSISCFSSQRIVS